MDWFEKLTGFRETSYEDTRGKLEAEGGRLRSKVNGASYNIGALELVSLQALRERAKASSALPGRLKATYGCRQKLSSIIMGRRPLRTLR